jgi:hypothetical protein
MTGFDAVKQIFSCQQIQILFHSPLLLLESQHTFSLDYTILFSDQQGRFYMTEETIFGALIGLAAAATQNSKTEDTDGIIRQALTTAPSEEALALIHAEKYRIAPGCATCAYPCGNTSDYDMSRNQANSPEVQGLKQALMEELKSLAARTSDELPDTVYQALSYLSYDLATDFYEELLQEMRL